jgi:hypothetical protein
MTKELEPCPKCKLTHQSRNYIDTHDVVHVMCVCGYEWVE